MKIHTTQNLNSLVQLNQQSTNNVQSKDFRLKSLLLNKDDDCNSNQSVTFKGNLPQVVKKVAKNTKPKGFIEKQLEKKWFRNVLDFMDHEVLVQAMIAGAVCMVLRPLTIMALSLLSSDSKKDNAYASAHSFASGATSILFSVFIAFGFSKGLQHRNFQEYANKLIEKGKDIKPLKENFKAMRPDIDLKTVFNESTGKVNKKELWRTVDGKKVPNSMKEALTVARPTHYSECSKETFKDFGVEVDLDKQKGKSLYEMVTTNGKKVIETLKDKDMFIAVKEEGMGGSIKEAKDTNFFSLKHIDKDFLQKIYPSIDIKTIEKGGKRVHPSQWQNKDGSKWLNKEVAENIHLSSFRETSETTPVYTGLRRPGEDSKYASYLDNIENYKLGDVPDELGTVITKEYLDADKLVDTKKKLTTWLPDILTRPIVAAGTIALIPLTLKTVFKMEKKQKNNDVQKDIVQKPVPELKKEVNKEVQNNNKVAFKGKFGDRIGSLYSKWYANSIFYKNKGMHKAADKTSSSSNMTAHMTVLGSFITSSVYMYRTMTNDKLEKDNRRTLAINQFLCFIIPTYAAYKVDHKLRDQVKNIEYKFSGIMKSMVQKKQISEAESEEFIRKLPNRIKNVKTFSTLVIFTTIYRYFTPVVITPLANFAGKIWKNHRNQHAVAKEIALNPNNTNTDEVAKEVALNKDTEEKLSKQVA